MAPPVVAPSTLPVAAEIALIAPLGATVVAMGVELSAHSVLLALQTPTLASIAAAQHVGLAPLEGSLLVGQPPAPPATLERTVGRGPPPAPIAQQAPLDPPVASPPPPAVASAALGFSVLRAPSLPPRAPVTAGTLGHPLGCPHPHALGSVPRGAMGWAPPLAPPPPAMAPAPRATTALQGAAQARRHPALGAPMGTLQGSPMPLAVGPARLALAALLGP